MLFTVVGILDAEPRDYSITVGSSMGGATALEAVRRGVVTGPVLLLAPALKRVSTLYATEDRAREVMAEWYEQFNRVATEEMKRNMLVVHGVQDLTVPIEDSRELCQATGIRLIEVPGKKRRAVHCSIREYI